MIVLITGASGGLGTTVTKAFLNAGATTVGVARTIKDEINHPMFHAIAADLSAASLARDLAETVQKRHGSIDVLVHLVGAYAGGMRVEDTDEGTLQLMFDVNFRSALYAAGAVLPMMRALKRGCILAVGSRAVVEPAAMSGVYSAAKSALASLIRTIAIENADAGVRANIVLPGTMDTPANRRAMPNADFNKWVPTEAVAKLLVDLAGNIAVNGAAIPIFGGEP